MATIGYARVSTTDQNLQLQLDALKGCSKVFTDTASGRQLNPGLRDALAFIRPGDTLMVWKLDRLGRSMRGLLELAHYLEVQQVNLRSLTDGIDTTTPAGRFFFHMMGALSQMERELIVERTRAGQASARAKGRRGGRPHALSAKKEAAARQLFAAGKTVEDVAARLGVSTRTLYRRLPADARQIELFVANGIAAQNAVDAAISEAAIVP
jgi:DNA invertase Pin-like site-specific DNA recombinase